MRSFMCASSCVGHAWYLATECQSFGCVRTHGSNPRFPPFTGAECCEFELCVRMHSNYQRSPPCTQTECSGFECVRTHGTDQWPLPCKNGLYAVTLSVHAHAQHLPMVSTLYTPNLSHIWSNTVNMSLSIRMMRSVGHLCVCMCVLVCVCVCARMSACACAWGFVIDACSPYGFHCVRRYA